jgi:ATP-dependent Lon protease
VRDEADPRASRTYIGALPGRIIQMMKKAGTESRFHWMKSTKCRDFRGDPSLLC